MAKDSNKDVIALAEKGDGVLIKRGSVWSYPGAPLDPSGTNLRLPIEYVTDDVVQAALADGTFVTTTLDPVGTIRAIRLMGEEEVPVITTAQAGTAEAGTTLPVGSRPSLDAGAADVSPNEAAKLAEASLTAAMRPAPPAAPVAPPAKPTPVDSKAK